MASTLVKNSDVTYIPGDPGRPATPGSPAIPGYWSTETSNVCSWIPNPDVTINYVWVPERGEYVAMYSYQGLPLSEYGSTFSVPLTIYSCHEETTSVYHQPVAAVPGDPGYPPTESQIIVGSVEGWNSYSRKISALDACSAYTFYASSAATVFLAIGRQGMGGNAFSEFSHAILVDMSSGTVGIYEYGVKVGDFSHAVVFPGVGISVLRGCGSNSNKVFYDVTGALVGSQLPGYTGGYVEPTYKESPTPISELGDMYIYVHLFRSGDSITSYDCSTDFFNQPDLYWGNLNSYTPQPLFVGSSAMLSASPMVGNVAFGHMTFLATSYIDHYLRVVFENTSSVLFRYSGANAYADMGALTSSAGDYAYVSAYDTLPSLYSKAEVSFYIPPKPVYAYGNLPIVSGSALLRESLAGSVSDTLPMFTSMAADYLYSGGSASLPHLVPYASYGTNLEMNVISWCYMNDTNVRERDIVMVLIGGGQLVSLYSNERVLIAEYISSLLANDSYSLLGIYSIDQLSVLNASSLGVMGFLNGAVFDENSKVWVVNMDNGASTQYEDYGFNSFFIRDGLSYGVANDGIYRLSGESDAGSPIQALLDIGSTRLGHSKVSKVPAVYINASSEGRIILKVSVDESEDFYYEARSESESLMNHRVDIGKGLRGNNWRFSLLNQGGENFELSGLEFTQVDMARRI